MTDSALSSRVKGADLDSEFNRQVKKSGIKFRIHYNEELALRNDEQIALQEVYNGIVASYNEDRNRLIDMILLTIPCGERGNGCDTD